MSHFPYVLKLLQSFCVHHKGYIHGNIELRTVEMGRPPNIKLHNILLGCRWKKGMEEGMAL